jgi:hypothetical protein
MHDVIPSSSTPEWPLARAKITPRRLLACAACAREELHDGIAHPLFML